MAEARTSSTIKRLTPNSVDVKIDGSEVRVAFSKDENAILNMIMASQMRAMIQAAIKSYKDKDAVLSPKEIADLAKAAKDVASFSAEIYSGAGEINKDEKEDKKAGGILDVNFTSLTNVTPKKDDVQREDQNAGTDGSRLERDAQG